MYGPTSGAVLAGQRAGSFLGGGRFPAKGIDQVGHIFLDKGVDMREGILVGGGVKIERAPQKMVDRVGDEELFAGGGVTAHFKEDAADAIWCIYHRIIDGTGLIGVFEGHFIGVIPELIEGVLPYLFIADVDAGAKTGEINIYPIWVFGYGIEITAVPDDIGVNGIFECVREVGAVEGLVLVGREVYFKIPSSFGRIDVIAGRQGKKGREKNNGTE